MKNDIYPLTIVKDRYNGTYSGGKWTAWNLSYVPSKIDADDMECADFFSKNTIVYGRGETPEEAIKDLKMILDCGISDPDEEDEEDKEMEPTSVCRIENIEDIWITQDVEGISLMLKNQDDLYKIMMTGDAIDNFNDTFVIAIKKEIEELKAKSKDISDDNASLLETNKKLKKELNDWKKEAADCLKLRDDAQKEAYKLKQEKTNLPKTPITDAMLISEYSNLVKENKQNKESADIWSREYYNLSKKFDKLKEEYKSLEDHGCHVLLHGMNFTPDELVNRILELEALKTPTIENFAVEEPSDNVNHPSHYTGKYECIDVMQDVFGDEATNDFCLCNAFKYIWRARKKNGLEDVKKAVWYLKKYIEEAEKDGEDEITGT